MLHFLNPAYYTKPTSPPDEVLTSLTRFVLRPNDEIGLHIHAWKSLVEYCGLNYKYKPTFSNYDRIENCSRPLADCGHTVNLEFAYS